MSPTKTALLSLSLALAFSGCASKNVTIIGEKRVDIVMHKSFQEGSLLKVVAELENDDFDEVEGFVYQIEWYDMNGILIESTAWKPITIHKNQKVQIVETSGIPNVSTYKIIVSVPNK
ncbi:MAG: DUF1425 domain-containing protein [Sulfuricurvum sp.]|uniref:DUF1425 domain-containing protein n=1 Tax=Sulfuricurvum sp. TaxID=2025608 RepID=UPI002734B413|nr:DUF1425 domain-containing protein [Sulfuricurvum sp.]MDP2850764.1 DUF1425 domain-containing protein [Sulfuricurvum sp.]MDP3291642.1 DUF1425 domain-containing protein [Sulfuricurvum sp.]